MKSLEDHCGLNRNYFKNLDASLIDVGGTLMEESGAYLCGGLIKDEKKVGHWSRAIRCYLAEGELILKKKIRSCLRNEVEAENETVKDLIGTLGKFEYKKGHIQNVCKKEIPNYMVDGAKELVDTLKDLGMEIYLVSLSSDLFTEPVADEIGADGFITHKVEYRNSVPRDVKIKMKSAMEKRMHPEKILTRKGISMKNVFAIANSYESDRFLAKSNGEIGAFACSPLTKSKELREISKIKLNSEYNYHWLSEQLRK